MDQSLRHLGLSFTSNYTDDFTNGSGNNVTLQSGVQLVRPRRSRSPMFQSFNNPVEIKLLGDSNIDDEKIKDILNFIVYEKLVLDSRVGVGPLIIDFLQRNALSGVTMVPDGLISHHNIREYEYHGFIPSWVPELEEIEEQWYEEKENDTSLGIIDHTFNGQVMYFNYFLWSRNQPLFKRKKIDPKEKWGTLRDSIPSSKRFKWQVLCGIFDDKNLGELRDLARSELIQHPDLLSKRELCKILAQRLETKIELKQRAIESGKCVNTTSLLLTELKDIPPEFFYTYIHKFQDGSEKLFCDDIRDLYTYVNQTNGKHPLYPRESLTSNIYTNILNTFETLDNVVNTMKDKDRPVVQETQTMILSRKLADLASKLPYPPEMTLITSADQQKFKTFVNTLVEKGILNSSQTGNLWTQQPLAAKVAVVELLIRQSDNRAMAYEIVDAMSTLQ
jgi:hypothetical protein